MEQGADVAVIVKNTQRFRFGFSQRNSNGNRNQQPDENLRREPANQ
jgi:hypothetical protein